ncbi:MAG: isoprenylcysteine carboxylmethyltransferase family protein [Hydrogenophaga sp.]|jgi:protein-S-isoprenylcysteine O-methyltransferase Ste14|nr:isoprenylcysteine carboxylmethyltransferase family protein [Hydrogenophaga sp.]
MMLNALELKIPPPVVALLLGVAAWWLAPVSPALAWPEALRIGLTVLLALLGLTLDFSGLVAFVRRHTTINPLSPRKSTALVTSGVYRFTRNPMYLGLACLLTAWAIWLGAWLPFAAPVLFVLYITRFQIQPEERVLAQLFGPAFTDYTGRVRRWI